MKTKFLTIATIALLGIGSTAFAAAKDSAATKNEEVSTVLTDVTKINKIEIHGNVEVYVSNANTDQVKVYNRYYSESALVQSHNGVLRISSYAPEKLVVWIKTADLRSISAYDNAEIKSFGKLSQIELNVDLHNNASAKLDMDAFNANVKVADHATADLSGTANDFSLNRDYSASVNHYSLDAASFSESTNMAAVDKSQDLAGL